MSLEQFVRRSGRTAASLVLVGGIGALTVEEVAAQERGRQPQPPTTRPERPGRLPAPTVVRPQPRPTEAPKPTAVPKRPEPAPAPPPTEGPKAPIVPIPVPVVPKPAEPQAPSQPAKTESQNNGGSGSRKATPTPLTVEEAIYQVCPPPTHKTAEWTKRQIVEYWYGEGKFPDSKSQDAAYRDITDSNFNDRWNGKTDWNGALELRCDLQAMVAQARAEAEARAAQAAAQNQEQAQPEVEVSQNNPAQAEPQTEMTDPPEGEEQKLDQSGDEQTQAVSEDIQVVEVPTAAEVAQAQEAVVEPTEQPSLEPTLTPQPVEASKSTSTASDTATPTPSPSATATAQKTATPRPFVSENPIAGDGNAPLVTNEPRAIQIPPKNAAELWAEHNLPIILQNGHDLSSDLETLGLVGLAGASLLGTGLIIRGRFKR